MFERGEEPAASGDTAVASENLPPENWPGAVDAGHPARAKLGGHLQWSAVTPGFTEGDTLPTSYWIGDEVVRIDRVVEEISEDGETYWRLVTQQGERYLVRRGRRWYLAVRP